MENNALKKQFIKKVHIVNLVCILIIAVIISALAVRYLGLKHGFTIIIECITICGLLAGVFFLPVKDNIKAIIFSAVPTAIAAFNLLTNSKTFPIGNHYLFFVSIAMISLYFNKKLILTFGIILNALILFIAIKDVESLFIGNYQSIGTVLALFTYINCVIALLFFLSKW